MQFKNLIKFKKNSKLIRLNKLYFDLLKTKHLLTFFLGGLKYRQFSKLWKLASNQRLFLTFLTKLECRLEFILLKSGFALSGKQAKQLILHGHVLVNNYIIRTYNYTLKLYDYITISKKVVPLYVEFLIFNLFKTISYLNFLRKKNILKKISVNQSFGYFKFSSFLEVNYRTFTLCLIKKPNSQEFFIPKIISLYDCNQLYFLL